jgi:hypothetical protein
VEVETLRHEYIVHSGGIPSHFKSCVINKKLIKPSYTLNDDVIVADDIFR